MLVIRRSLFAFLMLVTTVFIVATGLFEEYEQQPLYLQQESMPAAKDDTRQIAVSASTPASQPVSTGKPIPTTSPTATTQPTAMPTATPAPFWDDWSYTSGDLNITIEEVKDDIYLYYVADVRITDPYMASIQLKSAFADDRYGRNIRETASEMAERKGAILAINADYYGFHSNGVLIREGKLYRDKPYNKDLLVVARDGTLYSIPDQDANADDLLAQGVRNTFTFGPTLVRDDEIIVNGNRGHNPRTAIGMIEPGHYLVVVVDGRSQDSRGMTFAQLAQVFYDRGAVFAYNLDGGGSSTMVFMDRVLNNPSDDLGERRTSDILYFLDLPHALVQTDSDQ